MGTPVSEAVIFESTGGKVSSFVRTAFLRRAPTVQFISVSGLVSCFSTNRRRSPLPPPRKSVGPSSVTRTAVLYWRATGIRSGFARQKNLTQTNKPTRLQHNKPAQLKLFWICIARKRGGLVLPQLRRRPPHWDLAMDLHDTGSSAAPHPDNVSQGSIMRVGRVVGDGEGAGGVILS